MIANVAAAAPFCSRFSRVNRLAKLPSGACADTFGPSLPPEDIHG